MMKRQYIYWMISLLLISCESEMKIKIDTTPSKIVVNTSLTSGKEISAHISKSWSITTPVPDPELPQATVTVYVNDQFRGEMVRADKGDDPKEIKGHYTLPGSTVQPGDKIVLQVESPGYEPVSSEVSIPAAPDLLSIDTLNISSNEKEMIQIYIRLKDKNTERNYYRLIVEKESVFQKGDSVIITKTPAYSLYNREPDYHIFDYYYSAHSGFQEFFYIEYDDPVFRPPGSSPLPGQSEAYSCWGTFSDDLINGQDRTLKSILSGQALYSYADSSFSHTVYYTVQLLSVSESYYQYMKATWLFMLENWDLEGLREPFPTYTNVENGYGVVSAYQTVSKRFAMPRQDQPPVYTPFNDYP